MVFTTVTAEIDLCHSQVTNNINKKVFFYILQIFETFTLESLKIVIN